MGLFMHTRRRNLIFEITSSSKVRGPSLGVNMGCTVSFSSDVIKIKLIMLGETLHREKRLSLNLA